LLDLSGPTWEVTVGRRGSQGGDGSGREATWWPGSFLNSLRPDTLGALLDLGERRRYRAGEVLIEQGAPPEDVIVILSGRVKVTARRDDERIRMLAFRDAGDIVGELGVMDGGLRSASVTALGPVEGLRVTTARFRSFLEAHPDAREAVTRTVVAKLRMATDTRVTFDHQVVLVRVARRLLDQADFDGVERLGGTLVKLTQADLSELTGAAKPSVEKALRELREPARSATLRRLGVGDAPVIQAVAGKIVILRRDALERAASS
jgi:CRP/FNR family cyclic AMP-dependent transcriptional regulator